MLRTTLGTLALVVGLAGSAVAADVQPAVLYDIGGKFDKGFNEGAFHGIEKFKALPRDQTEGS